MFWHFYMTVAVMEHHLSRLGTLGFCGAQAKAQIKPFKRDRGDDPMAACSRKARVSTKEYPVASAQNLHQMVHRATESWSNLERKHQEVPATSGGVEDHQHQRFIPMWCTLSEAAYTVTTDAQGKGRRTVSANTGHAEGEGKNIKLVWVFRFECEINQSGVQKIGV